MRRHLLIIAYAFPPNSAVGAMRPLRLVKSLAAGDRWRATVITAGTPPRRRDDSLLAEVPPGVRTVKVPVFEPLARPALPTPRTPVAPPPPRPAATPAPRRGPRAFLRGVLTTPDDQIFWTPAVVARALLLHAQRPFDAVLVTSPPWSVQAAGAVLARLLRIPWLADYRDPWTDVARGGRPPRLEAWNRRLEEFLLPGAAAVVSTSETYSAILRERFPGMDPGRFVTIHNGFDEGKLDTGERPPRRRMTLVHLGTLYETWRPWAAFGAVRDWLAANPERRRSFVLRFVGVAGPRTHAMLAEHGLEDVVEITGFVPHDRAIGMCREADGLLLALGSSEGVPAGWLPSKLFEYIAFQRPILANVGPGEARDLILGARAGWVAADGETGILVDALEELWRRRQEAAGGPLPWANDPEAVRRLTQAHLSRRWLAALEGCLTGRGPA